MVVCPRVVEHQFPVVPVLLDRFVLPRVGSLLEVGESDGVRDELVVVGIILFCLFVLFVVGL